MKHFLLICLLFSLSCCVGVKNITAQSIQLQLPTQNKALFSKDQSRFYMYTDRLFEGKRSKPWQGGKYGFVRDQIRTKHGVILKKFHEGIDIRPVQRDASGNPLDTVHAISQGRVVYVNDLPQRSNYGRYIIVLHPWAEGPFYSLYAHLAATYAKVGDKVPAGGLLGKLGYTGRGLNKERAHLHLELNLLLTNRFQKWHNQFAPGTNYHGNYNGINLVGIDIASFFQQHVKNPTITPREFISRMEHYYTVTVPNTGTLAISRRYSWLRTPLYRGPSWEISLSRSGMPLRIKPSKIPVSSPKITWVRPSRIAHSYRTKKFLTGTGSNAKLTKRGLNYIRMLTGNF